jgi:hypothetical protein
MTPSAERHHLVFDIMPNVGAPEIGYARSGAPSGDDLLLILAEVGIVGRDLAAPAEPDARDPPIFALPLMWNIARSIR